jgi:uncharacterized damage-inducible protein DinB
MVSLEVVAKQSVEQRLERLQRSADDFAAAIEGRDDAAVSRRPDARNWSAKEVVCHLRDSEALFLQCLEAMVRLDEPEFGQPDHADRWAEERQYLRNDTAHALGVFRRHREATLAFLRAQRAEDWQRGGGFGSLGRFTVDYLLAVIAWHDDDHLDQLRRALEGRA